MTSAEACAGDVLALRGVCIHAGARPLIRHLDLDVRRTQIWCVLGPNGSGKSTLLHTLAGLREPQAGSIAFFGKPQGAWSARATALKRGLLLQQQTDAFSATVLETVLVGRHPHIGRFGWESEEDTRRAREAIARVDLAALAERDVRSLSGGERQRVALAMLLAQDPELLLLDEPTAHLDLAHQARLFEHLTSHTVSGGRTVVFATHDFNLAARFATHALLLDGAGGASAGPAQPLLEPVQLSRIFGFPLVRLQTPEGSGFAPRW